MYSVNDKSKTISIECDSLAELIAELILINQGDQPELLTPSAFAKRAGKSRTSVMNAMRRGRIPGLINASGTFVIPALAVGRINWGTRGARAANYPYSRGEK